VPGRSGQLIILVGPGRSVTPLESGQVARGGLVPSACPCASSVRKVACQPVPYHERESVRHRQRQPYPRDCAIGPLKDPGVLEVSDPDIPGFCGHGPFPRHGQRGAVGDASSTGVAEKPRHIVFLGRKNMNGAGLWNPGEKTMGRLATEVGCFGLVGAAENRVRRKNVAE